MWQNCWKKVQQAWSVRFFEFAHRQAVANLCITESLSYDPQLLYLPNIKIWIWNSKFDKQLQLFNFNLQYVLAIVVHKKYVKLIIKLLQVLSLSILLSNEVGKIVRLFSSCIIIWLLFAPLNIKKHSSQILVNTYLS